MLEQKPFAGVDIDGADIGRFIDPAQQERHRQQIAARANISYPVTETLSPQEVSAQTEAAWDERYNSIRAQIGRSGTQLANE
jgi:hypothetical protein